MLSENWPAHSDVALTDLVTPEDRPACERMIEEVCNGSRENFQIELVADRSVRKLSCVVWRFAASTERCESFAIIIEGPVVAKEDPRRSGSLETVGRMVGGVAHDFNNWVTGVLLQCDLLRASLAVSHPARRYAEEIREACLGATGFVRQLLALTKPTRAESRLLSLNDTVLAMQSMLVRLLGEKVTLSLDLHPKLGLIRIDPTQLQQILLNLVLNSRDATADGGEIRVSTSECKLQIINGDRKPAFPCVLLSIEDNGAGMDDETRSHAFEPFFTTKASSGTGLGLATVHDVVTSNGGLIHLDSAPGRGTRVTVLLPVATPARINDFYPQSGEVPSSTKEES